ncbi:MAG TPA: hypothetical protein DEQ80_01020 [Anaerolinea thermolimosa]|uniref:O-antigen ligase-related domain-containing protein n=1 Tax=Anaerolinea thermolimosa TaxID=229919 RepID=A0A3D1JDT7_9CHLR|nr:hypothetical protein [Anaerolinea thermolimosa]
MRLIKKIDILIIFLTIILSTLSGLVVSWLSLVLTPNQLYLLPLCVYSIIPITIAYSKIYRIFSQARWWHVIWILYFISGLSFSARSTESILRSPLDLSVSYRVVLIGIVVGALFWWNIKNKNYKKSLLLFSNPIGWVTTYALVCTLSTIWSVYPAWTLYRSIEYFTGIVLIVSIINVAQSLKNIKSFFDWTWAIYFLVLVLIWVGVVVWPDRALIYNLGSVGIQIQGVVPVISTNSVGEFGAIIGVVSFTRLLLFTKGKSRFFYIIVFIIALVTLIFSQSRSPLLGFLLGLVLVLLISKKIGLFTFLGLTILILISFTSLGSLFYTFFMRNQSLELFSKLSGRTDYWEFALPYILNRPLNGYGAYAGGRFVVAVEFSDTLSSTHGTWPEVLMGTGIFGLLPLIMAVLVVWLILITCKTPKYDLLGEQIRLESIGVLAVMSVRSIFTVSFIWHPATLWLLVVGASAFLYRYRH